MAPKKPAATGGGGDDGDPPGQGSGSTPGRREGKQPAAAATAEAGAAGAGAAGGASGPGGASGSGTVPPSFEEFAATILQRQQQLMDQQANSMEQRWKQVQQALAAAVASGQQAHMPVPATQQEVLDAVLSLAISMTKGSGCEQQVALLVRCANMLFAHAARGLRVSGTLLNILYAILEANPTISDTMAVGQAAQQAQAMGVPTSAGRGRFYCGLLPCCVTAGPAGMRSRGERLPDAIMTAGGRFCLQCLDSSKAGGIMHALGSQPRQPAAGQTNWQLSRGRQWALWPLAILNSHITTCAHPSPARCSQ